MNVLRSLESKIADLVEGTFGRVFRSQVQPIQIAHKLTREMDEHRTASVSRIYVPHEYLVWLSPEDRAGFADVEEEVIEELSGVLLEHARRESLSLASRPVIAFHTDERLTLGEFGIQVRPVVAGEDLDVAPAQAEHGHTMIYSTSERVQRPLAAARAARPRGLLLLVDGKRLLVGPAGAVIGRSRECDVVLDDGNVSRRHAELRPGSDGWRIADLGSTNGVRVNRRSIEGAHPVRPGDRLELGTTELIVEEQ